MSYRIAVELVCFLLSSLDFGINLIEQEGLFLLQASQTFEAEPIISV